MFFIQEEIPPVSDAFLEGRLEMTHKIVQQTQIVSSVESYATIVSLLLLFFFVFFFSNLRNIFNILPILLGSLSNRNISLNVEHIRNNYHNRNVTAYIMIIPTGMLAGRIGLLQPTLLKDVPLGWMILITVGFLLLYFLLRKTSLLFHIPNRISSDAWKVVQNGWMNYFIIGSFLSCLAGFPLVLFGVPERTASIVFLTIFGVLYIINFVRNTQIISRSCSIMATILYLCALEIIPTGALVLLGVL